MITQPEFESELQHLPDGGIDPRPLGPLVLDPASADHFVVAGPGTGKTTALALRALKLILVDDVDPGSILATTFTRRAAAEVRSRILQRADQIRRSLLARGPDDLKTKLARIDFNRIRTGTLDSLSQEILTDYRPLGSYPPVVIDQFLGDALMLRAGLFDHGRFRCQELTDYAVSVLGTSRGLSPKKLSAFVRELHERALYDQTDLTAFAASGIHTGVPIAVKAIEAYRAHLASSGQVDFALLEQRFLEELRSGHLKKLQEEIRIVLVDEYQDTNFLQELIYFELAKGAKARGGGITVVGDDDQALYRFRGATTSLFNSYLSRVHQAIGIQPVLVHLVENRRSTDDIVSWANDYVRVDPGYSAVRVPNKPMLVRRRQGGGRFPILGMFRPSMEELAEDLTHLIDSVVNGHGFRIQKTNLVLERNPQAGSAADIIMLSSSPAESGESGSLLPFELRQRLGRLTQPIKVYNPRGRDIASVPEVGQLLGLILECIDPSQNGPNFIPNLPHEALNVFTVWRTEAHHYLASNPSPHAPTSLSQFVSAWAARTPLRPRTSRQTRSTWPRDTPLLQLVYNLVTWFPYFQSDLEGLAYLEAVNRTITTAANLGEYDASVLSGPNASPHDVKKSMVELYWNVFVPLALDFIEVDEDLLETLPRDRLGVFSIHQSKGLEFPMVIVDVGSSFRSRHWTHAFKRYPRDEGPSSRIEDQLRRFSPLGVPTRQGRDRCFDDLIRQYFVAYSRPQDVLLLVGLDTLRTPRDCVEHVALGWDRTGSWHWPGLGNIKMI
ncbi:MAG: ATP-dependent helicase [Nitrososphaerota archaeon]|jgi:DNA helicase-2/ATP-dependent DNA helicase PcrA|nr:ATP-dependent helicase [Nitrososphaerota archaeon]